MGRFNRIYAGGVGILLATTGCGVVGNSQPDGEYNEVAALTVTCENPSAQVSLEVYAKEGVMVPKCEDSDGNRVGVRNAKVINDPESGAVTNTRVYDLGVAGAALRFTVAEPIGDGLDENGVFVFTDVNTTSQEVLENVSGLNITQLDGAPYPLNNLG